MEHPNYNSTSVPNSNQTTSMVSYKPVGITVLLGLCCLVGWAGNIAVINMISRQWNQRLSFTVKLMLNLAISDFLVLALAPVVAYSLLYGWTFGIWACRILKYLIYSAMYASVLTVTMMAVHHYYTVRTLVPYRHQLERLQKNRRCVLLIGLWSLALLFALPILFTQDVQFKRGSPRCQRTVKSVSGKVTALLFEVMLGFVLPFSTILVSYCWINMTKLQKGQTAEKRKRRMRMLVISIVTAFFIFWTPVHIINVIDVVTILTQSSFPDVYARLKSFRTVTGDLTKTVAVINCCVNPFLYAFASGLITKRREQKEKETSTNITLTNVS
ncbi:leukotriene B4 receptor 1-like [Trichomycterus rosablanca]|uniref:leukotriene B4 receptor 1-like n=1 Tax=Trichomycterus rosablanca TaxID=2290929 RepID=UPI002F36124C